MRGNPIVNEIHETREKLLKKYDGNLESLMRDSQKRTEELARQGRVVKAPLPSQDGPTIKKAG